MRVTIPYLTTKFKSASTLFRWQFWAQLPNLFPTNISSYSFVLQCKEWAYVYLVHTLKIHVLCMYVYLHVHVVIAVIVMYFMNNDILRM